jgi:antitoxin HicB
MFDYPVTLTLDDGAVLVTFVDVPEAITFGADEDEALLNAIDALETGLSFYVDGRKFLPAVSQPADGQKTVRPSALECAKLGVYQAMTEQGIKKAELARRLGWHMPQVDRLFDLRHASKLEQIEAAAIVLGRHIEVTVPVNPNNTRHNHELPR